VIPGREGEEAGNRGEAPIIKGFWFWRFFSCLCTTRSQNPGDRSQEPGARSQEPGARRNLNSIKRIKNKISHCVRNDSFFLEHIIIEKFARS